MSYLMLRSRALSSAFALVASVLGASPLLAQQTGAVRGTVVDSAASAPILGASIAVVGTRLGATTDAQGKYVVRGVAPGQQIIRMSRIGFAPQTKLVTIVAGAEVEANFTAVGSAVQLDQVVVTMTGAQRTKELGHAVTMLQADSLFKEAPIRDLSQMLNARVPGVIVNTQNGLTGTVSPIRIRGLNSFAVSNDPLVIVDGARIEGTPSTGSRAARLGDLNMSEVESMDVMKGPAAATLYGTDAANGVIVIRTKRGRPGQTKWEAFGEAGTIRLSTDKMYTPMYGWGRNAAGVTRQCYLIVIAAGLCTQDSITMFSPLKDKMNTPLSAGHRQQVGLQASGGIGQFRFFTAGAVENELGYMEMPLNDQARLKTERGGVAIPEEQIHPNFLRKENVRVNLSTEVGRKADLTFSNGLILQDFRQTSTEPFRAGYWGTGYNDPISHGYGFGDKIGDFFAVRQAEALTRYLGSLAGTYRPTEWLSTRSTLGFDFSSNVNDDLQKYEEGPPGINRTGRRSQANNNITQYSFDVSGTAERPVPGFSSLTSRTSIGVQYNRRVMVSSTVTGVGLPPGSVTVAGAATITASEGHAESIVLGRFIEQEIGWRQRLFGTVSLRSDGASTFGKDLHTTTYPKLGLSWLASEESFFPKIPGVSSLRLRSAWGASGVQPPSTASISSVTLSTAAINGASVSSATPGNSVGNPSIRPEQQTELEGGFDLEALSGRLSVQFTGYTKKSTDALVQVPYASSVGGGTRFGNIGSVSNKGLEGFITAKVVEREMASFDLTLSGSAYVNKLLSVGADAPPGFFANFTFQGARHRVGYPLWGNWQRPILSYADANGDGILAPSEIVIGDTDVYIGPGLPGKQLALTGNLGLLRNRLRLSTLFDWRGGYERYDYTAGVGCTLLFNCFAANDKRATIAQQAKVVAKSKTSTNIGFYSPGSYTRLREVSATVDLPQRLILATRAKSGSLNLSGRNLWIWSAFTGTDPEVNGAGTGGDLVNTFPTPPPPRYFIVRLNLSY